MGAEVAGDPPMRHHPRRKEGPPVVLGLQLSALVDHVARVDWSLLQRIPGDRGGSQQVAIEELNHILNEVHAHTLPCSIRTMGGGSVANTLRGLAAGFGISSGIIGACGDDDQGDLFVENMTFSGVELSRLRTKKGPTAQCVCLVDAEGNRTMRPCFSGVVKLQANELQVEDFVGSKWLVLRYAIFNLEQIKVAIRIAKQVGLCVSLDLASFEMVRDSRQHLISLLETGDIDLCFANEDEARELMRGEPKSDPEAAVHFLTEHCTWAAVTLGSKGCVAKRCKEIVRVPAIGEPHATDATGAGDLFASGFLYGILKGLPLEKCCEAGSCGGGAVVRSLGGEVRPESWQWMYKQMQNLGIPLPDLAEHSH